MLSLAPAPEGHAYNAKVKLLVSDFLPREKSRSQIMMLVTLKGCKHYIWDDPDLTCKKSLGIRLPS